MANPWTLTGKQVLLSIPSYPWEKIGFSVNEGPAALIRNGKVFITYSGSATDENYATGPLGQMQRTIYWMVFLAKRQRVRFLLHQRQTNSLVQAKFLPPT